VERVEHVRLLVGGDADAAVADLDGNQAAALMSGDVDAGRLAGERVLQRVADQVVEQLADHDPVGVHRGQGAGVAAGRALAPRVGWSVHGCGQDERLLPLVSRATPGR
jgi:hypothetical protein